jgi:hypothetical protein
MSEEDFPKTITTEDGKKLQFQYLEKEFVESLVLKKKFLVLNVIYMENLRLSEQK